MDAELEELIKEAIEREKERAQKRRPSREKAQKPVEPAQLVEVEPAQPVDNALCAASLTGIVELLKALSPEVEQVNGRQFFSFGDRDEAHRFAIAAQKQMITTYHLRVVVYPSYGKSDRFFPYLQVMQSKYNNRSVFGTPLLNTTGWVIGIRRLDNGAVIWIEDILARMK